jgi:two-component system nitrate/nitrite response regulator NarL
VLDVWLPDLTGIEVLRIVRGEGNGSVRVLMLSVSADPATVYEAIAAGASGFLLKDADHRTICEAALSAHAWATVLAPDLQGALAEQIRAHDDPDRDLLSAREREVLRLTSEGLSAREIASKLFLSPATVKTHLQHTYAKLEVSDRAAAVAEAIRRGFIV